MFNASTVTYPKLFQERLSDLLASPQTLGVVVSLAYAFGAVAQLIMGRLIDRLNLKLPFVFLTFCQVPLLLALAYGHGSAVVLFGALFMFAVFGQVTVNDAMVAHFVAPQWQARVFALRYFLSFGASAAAIPMIAYLEPRQGLLGLYLVLAGFAALDLRRGAGVSASGAQRRGGHLRKRAPGQREPAGRRWLNAVSEQFERHGGGFAAADAQRGDAALAAFLAQGVDQGEDDPRAGGTDRMALGAGAAIDIDLGMIEAVFAHGEHGDHGEGFVDLEQVDVVLAPAGPGEQVGHRADRRQGESRSGPGSGWHGRRSRASGFRPRRWASSAVIRTSAEAPSEIELALAAVMVPSLRNAGLRLGIFSRLAVSGCSSSFTTLSPLRLVTVTGTISAASEPSAMAAWAR